MYSIPPQRNGYYGGGDGPSRGGGGGLDRTPSTSVARAVGNNRSFRVDFGSVEMNDRCNNSGGGGGGKNNGESNGGGGGNGRNARDGSGDAYIGCYAKTSPLETVKEANSATRAATNSHADRKKMGLSATPVSARMQVQGALLTVTPLGIAKTVTMALSRDELKCKQ